MTKVCGLVYIFLMISVFWAEGNADTSSCFGCSQIGKLLFVARHTVYILNIGIPYAPSIHTIYSHNRES